MCGIIGYSGQENAGDIIIDALHSLEYRGYDSAGISVFTKNGLKTIKTTGRVDDLENKTKTSFLPDSTCGIGHTRWATHGKPSETNAHPHGTDTLMLVHNGIIENYKEIKEHLSADGIEFCSQTDTEVAAKLLEKNYIKTNDTLKAIAMTVRELKGSYALGIIFNDDPNTVYAVKKDSPLLVGISKNGNFIASDVSAFIKYTKEYLRPEDKEIVKITEKSVRIFDLDAVELQKKTQTVSWDSVDAQKAGFSHFMLKEIFEEPKVLSHTLSKLTKNGMPDFSEAVPDSSFFRNINRIHIIACGTAMHSGLMGKYYIEKYARVPVNVEIASEFRYSEPILDKNDLVIIVSQSGETADSLAALRLVNKTNIRTLSVVNTVGSTIARESEHVIFTEAGPEIAVASTKAFSVQTLVMMLLALKMSENTLSSKKISEITESLRSCVENSLHDVLCNTENIKKSAEVLAKHKDVFFIGRGYDSYLCQEASLKLKEISYIHSEAYPAGELKHGTISLIEEGTPVITLATDKNTIEKIRSNAEEVRSRGAFIISVCSENTQAIKDSSDICITVPKDSDFSRAITCAAVIQLLAYHTALLLGRDIDKPRNLAKSVTVE